jgi:hypothetical protein
VGRAFAEDARPFLMGQNDEGQNDEEIVDAVSGERFCEIDFLLFCPHHSAIIFVNNLSV